MLDVAIIGSGPAGVAAAINVRQRNRSLVLLGAAEVSHKLESAQEIGNYPGFPEIGGAAVGEAFHRHLDALGIAVERKYVDHVYPMGDFYALTSGEEMWEARSVVLATGVTAFKPIEGEIELLGRGVSYCATCDGRLYKGRPVLALAYDEDAEEEIRYLSELSDVTCIVMKKGVRVPEGVKTVEGVKPRRFAQKERGIVLETDGESYAADGAFVLRSAMLPGVLVPGLETEGARVVVNRQFATNLPGVFAAGDLTGAPYQIAKAVGEGATAGLSAAAYVAAAENGGKK